MGGWVEMALPIGQGLGGSAIKEGKKIYNGKIKQVS